MSILDDDLNIDINILFKSFIISFVRQYADFRYANFDMIFIPSKKTILHRHEYVLVYQMKDNSILLKFSKRNNILKGWNSIYFKCKAPVGYIYSRLNLYRIEAYFRNQELIEKDLIRNNFE